MDFKIAKYLIIFLLIQFNSQAVEFEGKFIQGHFILGKTDPGAKIQIDKKSVRVSKDGFFVFGLGRDRKNDVIITETLTLFLSICILAPGSVLPNIKWP